MMAKSQRNISKAELLRRLKKACEGGRLDFDEVVHKARLGEMQIWEVPGAVGVTSIGVSGRFKTCYVLAVAGRMAAVPELNAKVETFARSAGCQCIEMDGRPGWTRVHNKLADGYGPSTVKFRKMLEINGHGRLATASDDDANSEGGASAVGR